MINTVMFECMFIKRLVNFVFKVNFLFPVVLTCQELVVFP